MEPETKQEPGLTIEFHHQENPANFDGPRERSFNQVIILNTLAY